MVRLGEHVGGLALLEHTPGMQHGHGAADFCHHAEIVGDEQNRRAVALSEPLDQLQHLALHGDVKRGGRLVRDHKTGIAGERHRDQHALPHPAGDFVRIKLQHPLRFADRDLGEQLGCALPRVTPRKCEVMPQQGRDLRADAPDRIERGHRILRDQRDAAAEQAASLRLRHREQIASLEPNGASGDDGVGRQQAEHGAPEHRLAGAGFADQSPHLAGPDFQAGAAQHIGRMAAAADRDMQVVDGEHGRHRRCTGSSTVRRPSPSRLNPITLRMMQPIGSAMIQGA